MDMMYLDHIKITADDGGGYDRVGRLQRVIGYAQALADYYGNKNLLNKITGMHDREGTMTIFWREQPTEGEKEIFVKAWESRIGDGSSNVKHEIINT